MTYTIKTVKYGKDKTKYVPMFDDPSLDILSEFLTTEVQCFKTEIVDVIKKAKTTPEIIQFAGNVCLLSIENEFVKLECNIDDANIGDDVVIGLEEFEQVVLSWIKDIQK